MPGDVSKAEGGDAGQRPPSIAGHARLRAAAGAITRSSLTFLAILTIVFVLPRAMPGDPIQARTDAGGTNFVADAEIRARLLAYYKLDRPLVTQYGEYLVRVVHGDLGWSISRNEPVRGIIGQHLPWTLLLMGASLAISSSLSFIAGIGAAWHRGKARDLLMVTAMTGANVLPAYVVATHLLLLFAVLIPVLPLAGAQVPFAEYPDPLAAASDLGRHLILPATALAVGQLGGMFLMIRNTTLGVLGSDYMVLSRAKGLSDRRLKYHHAGRNALLPFLAVLGLYIGFAVGGALFVETVFGYPGMGSLILEAVKQLDYPLLEGCFLTLAAAVLLANLGIELVSARLDPRVGSAARA